MTNEMLTFVKKLVSVSGWWPVTVEPLFLESIIQRGESFGSFIIGLAFANVRVLIYDHGLAGVTKRENDWRIFPLIYLNRNEWREDKLYGLLLALVQLRKVYNSSNLFEQHFDRMLTSLGIGASSSEVIMPLEIGNYLFNHPKALEIRHRMASSRSSSVKRITAGYSEEDGNYGFSLGPSYPLVLFPEKVIDEDESLPYHWEVLLETLTFDFGLGMSPYLGYITKNYVNLFDLIKASNDFRKSLNAVLKAFSTKTFPRTPDSNKGIFLTVRHEPRNTPDNRDFFVKVEGRLETPSQVAYVFLAFWMSLDLICSPKEFEIVTTLLKNQLGKTTVLAGPIQEQANDLGANWTMPNNYRSGYPAGFVLEKRSLR